MSYNDSDRLNQAAAHDTGLYDPTVHDNHIVAMYDTDAQARAAHAALTSVGVPASAMQVVARGAETGTMGGVNAEDRDSGVWSSIRSLFAPEDDRSDYSHAIGRGHAMLVVTPTGSMDRQKIIQTLEASDPVDFDAKLAEWRQSGYDTTTPHADYAANTGYVAGMGGGLVDERAPSITGMARPTTTGTASLPTTAKVPGGMTTSSVTADRLALDDARRTGDVETIKIMEERLRVGKREVAGGAVRIRSYIVERPVEEQVTLHEEKVTIDRRPVDRAATQADFGAFQERTIEARATSEEAVVSKDARVVEEISLNKTASDRVETVRDTVRKTEVEIEDGTTALGATKVEKPLR